ncbi:MAG TPA: hypothetical protein VKG03_00445 [Solirubrobacterales bacterium]|nr:hypothetical protein [Solirubrobacterales bacterium]
MLPLGVPALPLDEAGKYVAGAYVVFLVLIVVYVAIMAAKLQRIEKELRELASFAEQGNTYPHMAEAEGRSHGRNIDETKPSADHDLTLSGPDEGRADHAESPPGGRADHPQGVPDV